MPQTSFPHIRVNGSPGDRGLQYGRQAESRIRRSIEIYAEIFRFYAGWDWTRVRDHAVQYEEPIRAYRAHFIDELKGIASGAGVAYEDVLAINVRTEIMNAAVARASAAECTCVVSLPENNTGTHTVIGQNWDWKPKTAESVVVLEAEPEGLPNFVSVVEAGLLAKTGMNAAGLGLVTNALVTDQDSGEPAVPYHAVLRGILESTSLSGALFAITYHVRASAANYLIAHRDGEAANVESAPGDFSRLHVQFPQNDSFAHTNHFLQAGSDFKDVGLWSGPDSLVRYHRMSKYLSRSKREVNVAGLQQALQDHFNLPYAVCSHPDPTIPEPQQYATIASVIMDLNTAHMWLADGNPCTTPFVELDYSGLLRSENS